MEGCRAYGTRRDSRTLPSAPPRFAGLRTGLDYGVPPALNVLERAEELNVSRQAVIKTMLRHALDQHYLATSASPVRRKAKAI
jgi:hypothetical protein